MPGNCPNVGLQEQVFSKQPYLVVYPNPSNELISVYADKAIDKVEIFDSRGVLVVQKAGNGLNLLSLDVNYLSGFYMLKIHLVNKLVFQKKLVSY